MKREIHFETLEKVAHVLKTIAHPVRLQILEELEAEEPLSVSEIRNRIELDVEQSMLSHHLIKMKDKSVLKSEKIGKQIFYRIADRQVLGIFDCMAKCEWK